MTTRKAKEILCGRKEMREYEKRTTGRSSDLEPVWDSRVKRNRAGPRKRQGRLATREQVEDFEGGLIAGTVFAERYEIISEIGRGGMCIVYLAHERLLDRDIALKILKRSFAADPHESERFHQEAKSTSNLKHPNIVAIISYGAGKDSQPYIAMEYLQGRTLEQVFKEDGRTSSEKFAGVFLPVLKALVYAHENRIIHRDLKPANIMLSSGPAGEQVKLLDFGIAKILEADGKNRQATRGLSGSPYYMSPEQCTGASTDPRSDIYSLACIMYEALVGKPPFVGETALSTMHDHLTKSITGLKNISRSLRISRALVETIIKALSKDPACRQQTMAEFEKEVIDSLSSSQTLHSFTFRTRPGKLLLFTVCAVLLVSFVLISKNASNDSRREAMLKDAMTANSLTRKTPVAAIRAGLEEIDGLRASGNLDKAEKRCRELVRAVDRTRRDDKIRDVFDAHMKLGSVLEDKRQYLKAADQFGFAADLAREPYSEMRLAALNPWCRSLIAAGEKQKAFEIFRENLKAAQAIMKDGAEPHMASAYLNFAYLLSCQGEKVEALENAEKARMFIWRLSDFHKSEVMLDACWLVYDLAKGLNRPAQARAALEMCKKCLHEEDEGRKDPTAYLAWQYASKAAQCGLLDEGEDMCKFAIQTVRIVRADRGQEIAQNCRKLLVQIKAQQAALAGKSTGATKKTSGGQ